MSVGYHFTPNRDGYYKNKRAGVIMDVEKLEPLCTAGRNFKMVFCYTKQYDNSQKIKHRTTIAVVSV